MASSVMAMARRSRATSSGDLTTRSRSVTGPASTNFQPGSARPSRKNVWYAVDDSSAMVPPPAPDPGLSRRTVSRTRAWGSSCSSQPCSSVTMLWRLMRSTSNDGQTMAGAPTTGRSRAISRSLRPGL